MHSCEIDSSIDMDKQYEVTSPEKDWVANEQTYRKCADLLVVKGLQVKSMHFNF